MTRILLIGASPSPQSRTQALVSSVRDWLATSDPSLELDHLSLRDLPAAELVAAEVDAPAIATSLAQLAAADGVVIVTPIYKAAYAGLLKIWVDLLPQFGFQHKVVLPLATGGSPAHILALDYALRPVLSTLSPTHIANGWVVLDQNVTRAADGAVILDDATQTKLRDVVEMFRRSLSLIHR